MNMPSATKAVAEIHQAKNSQGDYMQGIELPLLLEKVQRGD
jgi:hypothetical protein